MPKTPHIVQCIRKTNGPNKHQLREVGVLILALQKISSEKSLTLILNLISMIGLTCPCVSVRQQERSKCASAEFAVRKYCSH